MKMCSSIIFALKSIYFWFSLSSKQNAKSLLSESSTAQYATLKEITTTDSNTTDSATTDKWFRLMLFALHLLQKEVCPWPTALTQLSQLHSRVPEVSLLLVTWMYFHELHCIFCKLEACLHIYWSTLKKWSYPILAATLPLKQVRPPCFIVPEHLENLKIQGCNPKTAWHLN